MINFVREDLVNYLSAEFERRSKSVAPEGHFCGWTIRELAYDCHAFKMFSDMVDVSVDDVVVVEHTRLIEKVWP